MSWADLYGVVSRVTDSERAADAAREAYERWCLAAENDTMALLHRIAVSRAREMAENTGALVRVAEPACPPWSRGASGVRIRALGLSFRGCAVDVYWYRAPGAAPFVHLAHLSTPGGSRFPVMVTLPGCRVDRSRDGDVVLRDVSSPGAPERDVTPDAVLLRAFTVLVNGALR